MEVSSALLVAIMFVCLLSIGIGNILMSLASIVDRRSHATASGLQVSWIVMLLLVYFSLFWHTLDVLSVEEWTFAEFLYVMLGPVLVLFATQVMLPESSGDNGGGLTEKYFRVSRTFFLFLAGSQLWVNGVDLILRDGLTKSGAMNGIACVLALVLAASDSRQIHLLGAAAMWVLFVAAWILRGVGVLA